MSPEKTLRSPQQAGGASLKENNTKFISRYGHLHSVFFLVSARTPLSSIYSLNAAFCESHQQATGNKTSGVSVWRLHLTLRLHLRSRRTCQDDSERVCSRCLETFSCSGGSAVFLFIFFNLFSSLTGRDLALSK